MPSLSVVKKKIRKKNLYLASQESFDFCILCKQNNFFYLEHQGHTGTDAVRARCPSSTTISLHCSSHIGAPIPPIDLIFSLIGLYKEKKAKSKIFLTLGEITK